MGLKDWCHVNRKLLPFKLHFFFVGGFAGAYPFIPILAKQLGINATAVGFGYSMIPVFIFLSNPIIGFLVDYFQNIKVFLIILIVSSAVSYSSILFLPPIDSEIDENAYVRIFNFNNSEPFINLSMPFKRTCIEEIMKHDIHCNLVFSEDPSCDDKELSSNLTSSLNVFHNETLSDITNTSTNTKNWVNFYVDERSIFEINCVINSSVAFQCIPTIRPCLLPTEYSSVFYTYQFWTFMTLAVLGGITFISSMTISSVACYEVLGTNIEAYGRQRLFTTISWGLICYLAGTLNDVSEPTKSSFAAGFYLMAACLLVDITILLVIHIPKAHYSNSMCSDLGKIFSSIEILTFAFGATIVGICNSIIAVYEFWYLQDLGANQTLLGLTVAMQCLVGETPFLFFSGWIVNKLGHFLCLVSVFAGFAVRMLLYSLLKNPWLVLPIDILHGVTFGIYHGALTSFAKIKAPKGMEATLLGLLGGLYDGLGYGIGSFLGGVGLDNLGARRTFFSASMLSVTCLFAFLIASYFFRSTPKKIKTPIAPLAAEDTFCVE